MKDITYFVQERLYPRTWNYIDRIFPEMQFSEEHGRWISPKNINGTEPRGKRKDKCVINPRIPTRIIENGEGGSKDIIDLYMSLNSCTPFEAIKQIADIIGEPLPEQTPEESDRWKKYKDRMDAMEQSLERQKEALYTEEGKVVLDYLHNRGWKDEQIRKAELGYCNADEARRLNAQTNIGTDFILSIPLRSSGRLYSFKFRYVTPEAAAKYGKGKYRYLKDSKKELFGLTGIKQKDAEAILVEGELDALHMEVVGFKNVVATSGCGLTRELAEAAKNRGISFITLLLDSDGAGQIFVEDSAKVAYEQGLTCFVATIPDGCKDADEYLKNHTKEELQQVIRECVPVHTFQYYQKREQYVNEIQPTAEWKDFIMFRNEVIDIALGCQDHMERDMILGDFSQQTQQAIDKQTLQERADYLQAEADRKEQKEQTDKAIRKADELLQHGNTAEAIKVMGEASRNLSSLDKRAKFNHLFDNPTAQQLHNRISSKPDEIETGYAFSNPSGKEEILTLPTGAITFVCAPTSHGKSTLLQNIALQVSATPSEGDTLYFTYEEDSDDVLLQMINKYVNIDVCRNYNDKKSNNIRAISHLWRTGEDRYITDNLKGEYHKKEEQFLSEFIENGRLKLFYEDYDSTELIEAIETYGRERKIKAVFIDYVQLLYIRGCKLQRTEELKEICKDLKNLAIRMKLPIIVAAQLNRQTTSPLELHSQNIAEAADLERIANKVVCLWNSSFAPQKSGDQKTELTSFMLRTGITLGTGGFIYAKLTKNRGGVVGLDATLTYNGNTGVVVPNYNPKQREEEKKREEAVQLEMDSFL